MKQVFTGEQKLGDIVSRFPKASEIFKEYQIDFCCGGNRSLSEAAKKQNVSEEKILETLNQAFNEIAAVEKNDIDWTVEPDSKLIDHIINTHHAYLQVELPKISELTAKILRAHGSRHGEELTKVFKLFGSLRMELEQHLIKEEEVEFPMIKQYEKAPCPELHTKALRVMKELECEHQGAGDILKELRKVTNNYELPYDACPTYELAFGKLMQLEADLFEHIHLENNILFPRFEKEVQASSR